MGKTHSISWYAEQIKTALEKNQIWQTFQRHRDISLQELFLFSCFCFNGFENIIYFLHVDVSCRV